LKLGKLLAEQREALYVIDGTPREGEREDRCGGHCRGENLEDRSFIFCDLRKGHGVGDQLAKVTRRGGDGFRKIIGKKEWVNAVGNHARRRETCFAESFGKELGLNHCVVSR
jgi:hypothetical protein